MDKAVFEHRLGQSLLFTTSSATADGFTCQIESIVSGILDSMAPLKAVHCLERQLSQAALDAKGERSLERQWNRSGKESDRVMYREWCKKTNEAIQPFLSESQSPEEWSLWRQPKEQIASNKGATPMSKKPYIFHTWWRCRDIRHTRKLCFETKWWNSDQLSIRNLAVQQLLRPELTKLMDLHPLHETKSWNCCSLCQPRHHQETWFRTHFRRSSVKSSLQLSHNSPFIMILIDSSFNVNVWQLLRY